MTDLTEKATDLRRGAGYWAILLIYYKQKSFFATCCSTVQMKLASLHTHYERQRNAVKCYGLGGCCIGSCSRWEASSVFRC
eukprot:3016948-Amphidinium_carterae.1